MSQARISMLDKLSGSIREMFRSAKKEKAAKEIKTRQLVIDALEERHLLSLSIGSVNDVLVNPEWQDIRGDVAFDINESNDIVAAWTAADQVTDPDGKVVGEDLNIYARYMTDEVQVLTLAVKTADLKKGATFSLEYGSAAVQRLSFSTASIPNAGFSRFSGISDDDSGDAGDSDASAILGNSVSHINGTFKLSINGTETADITFSDLINTPKEAAELIESAIHAAGFTEVDVVAYTERQFDITWNGLEGTVPEVQIIDQNFPEWGSVNFCAGAIIETISEPTVITSYSLYSGNDIGIALTNDAQQVAQSIQKAFNSTLSTDHYAPVQREWLYNEAMKDYSFMTLESSPFRADRTYDTPSGDVIYTTRAFPQLEVSVQALNTVVDRETGYTYFQFQITYTGNSGYINHQQLTLKSLDVKSGGSWSSKLDENLSLVQEFSGAQDYVDTLKESSSVFRVNEAELPIYALDDDGEPITDVEGNPMIISDGKTDQYRPSVAFNDFGTFVVAWESAVEDKDNPYNYTDIFARRFTIQGYIDTSAVAATSGDAVLGPTFCVDGGTGTWNGSTFEYTPVANVDPTQPNVDASDPTEFIVQGVRPLADQFQVNVEENGTQEKPSAAIDQDGRFAVSWTTDSQWNDYFAGIEARWFDETGLASTGDVLVNIELRGTPDYGESYTVKTSDGVTIVVWLKGETLYRSLYAPGQETPFVDSQVVATNAYGPSIDFDNNGRYVISWTQYDGSTVELGMSDVYSTVNAAYYHITSDASGNYSETVESSGSVTNIDTGWPTERYTLSTGNAAVGVDADGDAFIAYAGYGFDTQETDTDINGSSNYSGAAGNMVYLYPRDLYDQLSETGTFSDLFSYFRYWFTGAYDTYVATRGKFVDVDSYVSSCLASIQNQITESVFNQFYGQIRDTLNDSYYDTHLEEQSAILTEIQDRFKEAYVNTYGATDAEAQTACDAAYDALYLRSLGYYDGWADEIKETSKPDLSDVILQAIDDPSGSAALGDNAILGVDDLVDRDVLVTMYRLDVESFIRQWYDDNLADTRTYDDYTSGERSDNKVTELTSQYYGLTFRQIALEISSLQGANVSEQERQAAALGELMKIETDEAIYRAKPVSQSRAESYTAGWADAVDSFVLGREEWAAEVDDKLVDGVPMGVDDLSADQRAEQYQQRDVTSYTIYGDTYRDVLSQYTRDDGTLMFAVDSSYIKGKVQKQYPTDLTNLLDEKSSADPDYQEALREGLTDLGTANAVLESILTHFRGAGNDILYTTFNVIQEPTTGDARGVINAQRDGINTKYYLALPAGNIAGGTLTFTINCENTHFDDVSVPIGLVVDGDTYRLKPEDMAQAIVDAINAVSNLDAGYYDSVAVRILDHQDGTTRMLFEGTNWEWQGLGKIDSSRYFKNNYNVFEITFQGGAHDSNIYLTIDRDNSTISYHSDLSDLISELSDEELVNQGLYSMLRTISSAGGATPTLEQNYNAAVTALRAFANGSASAGEVTFRVMQELVNNEEALDAVAMCLAKTVYHYTQDGVHDYCTDFDGTPVGGGMSGSQWRAALEELVSSGAIDGQDEPTLTGVINHLTMSDAAAVLSGLVRVLSYRGTNFTEVSTETLDYRHSTGDYTDEQYNWLRTSGKVGTEYIYYVPFKYDEPWEDPEDIEITVGDTTITYPAGHYGNTETSFVDTFEALNEAVGDLQDFDESALASEYSMTKYYTGYRGTNQHNPAVGMNNSGSIVVAWQQESMFDGRNTSYEYVENSAYATYNGFSRSSQIYLRTMIESTDYAGAQVTKVRLADGTVVKEGDTITTATANLVVSFTENLKTVAAGYEALHSVDNIDNWSLLCDGILVDGAIESITFSMSNSRRDARTSGDVRINGTNGNPESLAYGSNLWEAVITFKEGFELTGGDYTLIASNRIQDIAGNAINSNGDGSSTYGRGNRDGEKFEFNFHVLAMDLPLAFDDARAEDLAKIYYSPQEEIQGDNVGDNRAQYTTEELLDETAGYHANTPTTVASDANGNFVAVWTETEKDDQGVIIAGGIYYKAYRQEFLFDRDGNRISYTEEISSGAVLEYELNGDAETGTYRYTTELADDDYVPEDGFAYEDFLIPQQASVAIDDAGHFTVVWDMAAYYEPTDSVARDVFARRYSLETAGGGSMSDRDGLPEAKELGFNDVDGAYRINIECQFDQQNASVAMDSDGDIVIVWESWGQDGDGWGIYGRRFDNEGMSFGRTNTIQRVSFSGSYSSVGNCATITFLDEDGNEHKMERVKIESVLSRTAANFQDAFYNYKDPDTGEYLFRNEDGTSSVLVNKQGTRSLVIEFVGRYALQSVEPLQVDVYETDDAGNPVGEANSNLSAYVTSTSTGATGSEFLINDTTESHQRFASIGMCDSGEFVVSWTSWGQDLDDPTETNIYMKTFVSNHGLRSAISSSKAVITSYQEAQAAEEFEPITVEYEVDPSAAAPGVYPQIITTDVPANHDETGSGAYSGVCTISVEGDTSVTMGTGALLATGMHVLTAAHVVCDAEGMPVSSAAITVTFTNSAGQSYVYNARALYVHGEYTNAETVAEGVDLAVILLDAPNGVDATINSFDLYRDSNEIGQSFTMLGYGEYNSASLRLKSSTTLTGVKHSGMNTFDLLGSSIDNTFNTNLLCYDFDNGYQSGDTFGNAYGYVHYGLGTSEAMSSFGDSGGPALIDGKIAGVISWGNTPSDQVPGFGSYAAAVRVSAYADWIDGIMAGSENKEILVNRSKYDTAKNAEYQRGIQIWSDAKMDNDGNVTVTWTSFDQDGHGDTASGATSNGLGGIYMKRYYYDLESDTDPDDGAFVEGDVTRVNDYTGRDQIHSKLDMDQAGNFVITWESDQGRVYTTDQPISTAMYAKRFVNTTDYVVFLVRDFDGLTQTVVNTGTGTNTGTDNTGTDNTGTISTDNNTGENEQVVITYNPFNAIPEYYPETVRIAGFAGVYVQDGSIGSEFRVDELATDLNGEYLYDSEGRYIGGSYLDDQKGGAVALNGTGDMVFVWTDTNNRTTVEGWKYDEDADQWVWEGHDARVVYRTVTLADDDVPPYVTSVNAAYRHQDSEDDDPYSNVSLMGSTKTFGNNNGPKALVYTFNELMFSSKFIQDIYNDIEAGLGKDSTHIVTLYDSAGNSKSESNVSQSVVNNSNWTLLKDGAPDGSIQRIYYGLNAGSGGQQHDHPDYNENVTNEYELVIEFKEPLTKGYYKLTLADSVTDLANNKLDGNYDGYAGASFSIDFKVIAGDGQDEPGGGGGNGGGGGQTSDPDPDSVLAYLSTNPRVVTFGDGSFIVVAEGLDPLMPQSEQQSSTTANDNNTTNDDDDDDDEPLEYDIVFRRFTSSSAGVSAETIKTANTYTVGSQIDPSVDGLDGDCYGVVWSGEGSYGDAIYARFYQEGCTTTTELLMNDIFLTTAENNVYVDKPEITYIDEKGQYLVTWRQRAGYDNMILGRVVQVSVTENSTCEVRNIGEQFVIARTTSVVNAYESYSIDYNEAAGCFAITWSENLSSGSPNVFYRTFTYADMISGGQNAAYDNFVISNGSTVRAAVLRGYNTVKTRVNQTLSERQYSPDVSINDNGEVFVAWVSTQNFLQSGRDIYLRVFSADGTALTGEQRVNTETNNSPLATNQYEPSISAGVGGYVITWTSMNSEGRNWDLDARENLRDLGVMGCAYTLNRDASGTITGSQMLTYSADGTWSGAVTTDSNKAIFVVNDMTNGDQYNSDCAVAGWINKGGVSVPKLVVVWDGVLRTYKEASSSTNNDNTNNDNNNNNNNNNNGNTGTAAGDNNNNDSDERVNADGYTWTDDNTVFYKWYMLSSGDQPSSKCGDSYDSPAFYVYVDPMALQQTTSSTVTVTSEVMAGIPNVIIAAANVVSEVSSEPTDTLVIAGTAGNDTLELIVSEDGSWTAVLNGRNVASSASGFERVVMVDGYGCDTFIYRGGSASSVVVTAESGLVQVNTARLEFLAAGMSDIRLNAAAAKDSLTVYTSKGNDRVTMGIGDLTLTSSGKVSVTAGGFEEILAYSSAGNDHVVLLDSSRDDRLKVSARKAVLTGGGWSNSAVGFASVEVNALNGGHNTAQFTDLTSLSASSRYVLAQTGQMLATAVGFETVDAAGTGAASLFGTSGSDRYTSDKTGGRLNLADGHQINVSGFTSVTVDGNGGNDTAEILYGAGHNLFSAHQYSANLANRTGSQTVNNFSHVKAAADENVHAAVLDAVFYDTYGDDTLIADADGVSMLVDGNELYEVLACNQVATAREANGGVDRVIDRAVESVIDATGWDL